MHILITAMWHSSDTVGLSVSNTNKVTVTCALPVPRRHMQSHSLLTTVCDYHCGHYRFANNGMDAENSDLS